MKINASCMRCVFDGHEKDKNKEVPYVPHYPYWEYPEIELDSTDNYYEFVCNNGHKNKLIIQIELYDLLFQQATYCIMDGYYREAIGTFNTSIERFMEYCTEILFLMDNQEGMDFSDFWKLVSKRSERQIGAFYLSWCKYFHSQPDILENLEVLKNKSYSAIRNSVIHNGEMATREEAVEFGEATFNFIRKHKKILDKELNGEREFLPFLRSFRNQNKSKKIIDARKTEGTITSLSTQTFLSNEESIVNFIDCFEEKNILSYGILK